MGRLRRILFSGSFRAFEQQTVVIVFVEGLESHMTNQSVWNGHMNCIKIQMQTIYYQDAHTLLFLKVERHSSLSSSYFQIRQ